MLTLLLLKPVRESGYHKFCCYFSPTLDTLVHLVTDSTGQARTSACQPSHLQFQAVNMPHATEVVVDCHSAVATCYKDQKNITCNK